MHITSLLLTFFARFMPELIHNGNIYVSCPPLYGVQLKNSKSDKLLYFWDSKEMNTYMDKKGLLPSQYTAYYYKGLGELSAQQLYDSCLDPKERVLKQVNMDDIIEVDEVIRKLMGSDAKSKREFLTTGEL